MAVEQGEIHGSRNSRLSIYVLNLVSKPQSWQNFIGLMPMAYCEQLIRDLKVQNCQLTMIFDMCKNCLEKLTKPPDKR